MRKNQLNCHEEGPLVIADIARALRRESSDESGLAEVLEDEKCQNKRRPRRRSAKAVVVHRGSSATKHSWMPLEEVTRARARGCRGLCTPREGHNGTAGAPASSQNRTVCSLNVWRGVFGVSLYSCLVAACGSACAGAAEPVTPCQKHICHARLQNCLLPLRACTSRS